MTALILLLLLAAPGRAAPRPWTVSASSAPAVAASSAPGAFPLSGTVESSRLKLAAQDAPGALADAETALARGGGADAYAARADAKRALGRPLDEIVADYAKAADLDPRYVEKYQGLLVQRQSELLPGLKTKAGPKGVSDPAEAIADVMLVAMVAALLVIITLTMLYGRDKPVPRDKR